MPPEVQDSVAMGLMQFRDDHGELDANAVAPAVIWRGQGRSTKGPSPGRADGKRSSAPGAVHCMAQASAYFVRVLCSGAFAGEQHQENKPARDQPSNPTERESHPHTAEIMLPKLSRLIHSVSYGRFLTLLTTCIGKGRTAARRYLFGPRS